MKKISKPKILLYELNEVPWRVVDLFIKESSPKKSNLEKLLRTSTNFTTKTVDSGELHPWSTWPTIHRGVSNDIHQIKFINQDISCAKKYPPIWRILIDNKIDIGIFGALQSFPPIESKFSKFYIPDTFAPREDAIPKKLSKFQKFNLNMTKDNKAIQRKISVGGQIINLLNILASLKLKSIFTIARHIILETLNPIYKTRRSTMQPVIAFDLFFKLLKKTSHNMLAFSLIMLPE